MELFSEIYRCQCKHDVISSQYVFVCFFCRAIWDSSINRVRTMLLSTIHSQPAHVSCEKFSLYELCYSHFDSDYRENPGTTRRKEEKGGWVVRGRDTPVLNSSFSSDCRGRYVFAYLLQPPARAYTLTITHRHTHTQDRTRQYGAWLDWFKSYFCRSVSKSCPVMAAGEIRVVRGDKR